MGSGNKTYFVEISFFLFNLVKVLNDYFNFILDRRCMFNLGNNSMKQRYISLLVILTTV